MLPLGILALGAALAYYVVETRLIALVISLSQGKSVMTTWRERYRWLAEHYLVLGIMGLFLEMAHTALGPLSGIVFMLPVLMMQYAQEQYVEPTERSVRELKRINEELTLADGEIMAASQAIRQLNDELFLILPKIIDAPDRYMAGHAARVAEYATATELRLSPEHVEQVCQARFLHDIGKVGISEGVLHKREGLTPQQYEYFQGHAALGADFLETCHGLRHLAPFVRHHHEHWDGSGYPDELLRGEIPLEAGILAICDPVEAMAWDRPYRPAMSLSEIIDELRHSVGTQFDPLAVEACARVPELEVEHLVINPAPEVRQKQADNGNLIPYRDKRLTLQFQESVPCTGAGSR